MATDVVERQLPLQLGDAGDGGVDLPPRHIADGDGAEFRTNAEAARAWLNRLGHYSVEGALAGDPFERPPEQVRSYGRAAMASARRRIIVAEIGKIR